MISTTNINEIWINKKSEWVSLIKKYPKMSVTELRVKNPVLYAFLYRNDMQWLKDHSPKQKRDPIQRSKVDWEKRDLFIKAKIESATKILLSYAPPKRITISSLGAEISKQALLQKHLHKLPESSAILKECVEDVAFRRDE